MAHTSHRTLQNEGAVAILVGELGSLWITVALLRPTATNMKIRYLRWLRAPIDRKVATDIARTVIVHRVLASLSPSNRAPDAYLLLTCSTPCHHGTRRPIAASCSRACVPSPLPSTLHGRSVARLASFCCAAAITALGATHTDCCLLHRH
eukprot:scaffold24871_cov31-Tisochrysis_lutea.AAC.2